MPRGNSTWYSSRVIAWNLVTRGGRCDDVYRTPIPAGDAEIFDIYHKSQGFIEDRTTGLCFQSEGYMGSSIEAIKQYTLEWREELKNTNERRVKQENK